MTSSRNLATVSITLCCVLLSTAGCSALDANRTASNTSGFTAASTSMSASQGLVQVDRTAFDPQTDAVTLWVHPASASRWMPLHRHQPSGENIVDISTPGGAINYATSSYPAKSVRAVHFIYDAESPTSDESNSAQTAGLVSGALRGESIRPARGSVGVHTGPRLSAKIIGRLQPGEEVPVRAKVNRYWYEITFQGKTAYVTANPNLVKVTTGRRPTSAKSVQVPAKLIKPGRAVSASAATGRRIHLPPPGVHIDKKVQPAAKLTASIVAKQKAVMRIARNKLNTPYIWGHNEDRGQYGFDCSNYTEYVYHHALGYSLTTSSRAQYKNVGLTVPRSRMRVGDLLVFERGKHVGIYAGHNRMIQEGGGLGKVGYLSLGPKSYWGKHLTVVRRMF